MNMKNPKRAKSESSKIEPYSFQEKRPIVPLNEIGSSGVRISGGQVFESRLSNFRGSRRATIIREMVETDSTVAGLLLNYSMIGRNVEHSIESEGKTSEDKRAVEHVEQCLEDMEVSFEEYVTAFFSVLPYGYAFHEVNLKMRQGEEPPRSRIVDEATGRVLREEEAWPSAYDDGLIGWAGWPVRKHDTISRWGLTRNGRVTGAYQRVDYSEGVQNKGEVFIPVKKAIYMTRGGAEGSPDGKSILEPCYRPWFFKRNFEDLVGIGVKRDMVGYPMMSFPKEANIWLEANKEERAKAELLIANLFRDEYEGLVKPEDVKLELVASPGTPRYDVTKLMAWLRLEIAIGTLTEFALVGHEGTGSLALKREATRVFMLALDGVLKVMAESITKQAIKPLIRANQFAVTEYPVLKFGTVDVPAVEGILDSLKKIADAGGPVFPDPELQKHLYNKLQVPIPEDEDLLREKEEDVVDEDDEEPDVDDDDDDDEEKSEDEEEEDEEEEE